MHICDYGREVLSCNKAQAMSKDMQHVNMHGVFSEMQWAFSQQFMDLGDCPNDVGMLCCIEPAAASVYTGSHLEVVDQTVIPNFNVHTQIIMSIDLLSAQNELQSLVNSCIFAFGRCCELLLAINCHLHCSALHT